MGRVYFPFPLVSEVQLQLWQHLIPMDFSEVLYRFSRMSLGFVVSQFFDCFVGGSVVVFWRVVGFVCFASGCHTHPCNGHFWKVPKDGGRV